MSDQVHLQIRGGIEYDHSGQCWRVIIHVWHNAQGLGTPESLYQWPETYRRQDEALRAYTAEVRPAIDAMIEAVTQHPDVQIEINRWGLEPR